MLVALGACRGRPHRPLHVTWARTPAYGTPSSCPDDAVDLTGDRIPTTTRTRCSYADDAAGQLVVAGTVLAERDGGLAEPVRDAEVELVLLDPAGVPVRTLGRTHTDAQGGFSIRTQTRLPIRATVSGTGEGEGALQVRSAAGRSQPVRWKGRGPWRFDDVRVLQPRTAPPSTAPRP